MARHGATDKLQSVSHGVIVCYRFQKCAIFGSKVIGKLFGRKYVCWCEYRQQFVTSVGTHRTINLGF